ncbi:uncharacterized protein PFL1_00908 [Pseudozyma flocculosa PF-1]|uniref:uncharacterized protein n=1 Tax=Pseudozyma flocculosa PF-1 TaxID=1277687 RepID=UPI0004560BDE|nr:uncharacterized protein PFL1_00908 [Pseudozyma flocculosa PF-1]EPQ31575.1 hypothetical protein PFL1_00908 [Pseudozyma flocculosa PF-1]
MLSKKRGPGELVQGFRGQVEVLNGYVAIVKLHREGQLGIDLEEVVKSVMRVVWKRRWEAASCNILLRLADDFPRLGDILTTPILHSACRYSAKYGRPTSEGMRRLSSIDISKTTVSNVLLSAAVANVDFLLEVARSRMSEDEVAALIRDTLPKILCQPWRRGILLSLHSSVANFAVMLGDAVLAQDFEISQLDAPTRYPSVRSQVFGLEEPVESRQEHTAFHHRGHLRSILSYDGSSSENIEASSLCEGFFTDFWRLNGRQAPGHKSAGGEDSTIDDGKIRGTPLFGIDAVEEAPSSISNLYYEEVEQHMRMNAGRSRSLLAYNPRSKQYGFPKGYFTNSQSSECVEILGRSRASNVILSHALINESHELVTRLITKPHSLCFDLSHWKLLAWLGRAPSDYMVIDIVLGAPFSIDSSLGDELLTDELVLKASRRISRKDKKAALEKAESDHRAYRYRSGQ